MHYIKTCHIPAYIEQIFMIFIQRTGFNVRGLECFYMAPTLSEEDSLRGRLHICTQFLCYLQCWILAVFFGDPSYIYTNTGFIGKKWSVLQLLHIWTSRRLSSRTFCNRPPAVESISALPFPKAPYSPFSLLPDSLPTNTVPWTSWPWS